jgi:lipopolysaccharide/colanic/teichoic acid biosynthesis glycosyltransferase
MTVPGSRSLYARGGKRLLDICLAGPALLLLLPLLVLGAAAVLVTMGRPILHNDWRAGLNGAPFLLRKLRTMSNARDAAGRLLPDGDRLTRLGRVLRALSIDELPQLLHVLKGEMTLVGPRPLPFRYVSRYSGEQARRLFVKPGITGVAQVLGRNATTWDERFKHDLFYVEHRSFRLDLIVLLATVAVVLKREGVSHPDHATMHEFLGSEPSR